MLIRFTLGTRLVTVKATQVVKLTNGVSCNPYDVSAGNMIELQCRV